MLSGGVRTLITVIPGGGGCNRLYDDVNGNGRIDVADVVWLFNRL
jgi:hypothetical protein